MNSRIGNKWSVNELLSLQREYELLEWSIDQIARKHRRTPLAIIYKLDHEGLANFNVLHKDYYKLDKMYFGVPKYNIKPSIVNESENVNWEELNGYEDSCDEDSCDENSCDEDSCKDLLSSRVSKIETELSEIKDMLKLLTSSLKPTQRKFNGVPRGCDH